MKTELKDPNLEREINTMIQEIKDASKKSVSTRI